MKVYIDQFYNEGFATTFYLKPVNFFKKRLKNGILLKIIVTIIKIVYTILMFVLAWFIFWDRYPL